MTKTWHPLAGTTSWNTLAKRRSPRPLLVVHSGNTTTGRPADLRISLSGRTPEPFVKYGGRRPVRHIICRRETWRNPLIGIDGTAECFWGDWILAEPVPVTLPGLFVMGAEWLILFSNSGRNSGTGSTNTGLQLWKSYINWEPKDKSLARDSPSCKPKDFYPRCPVGNYNIPSTRAPRFISLSTATASIKSYEY